MEKCFFGIDVGGTFVKGAIVDKNGKVIVNGKIPTESDKGEAAVVKNIATLCRELLQKADMDILDIKAVGMGVPGMIDGESGIVVSSGNLKWYNFNVKEALEAELSLPVRIANDANAAALGELKFGLKNSYKNMIMITLGTGVGGGIIIDGKIYEGNKGGGAELGHDVIVMGGEPCTCGRRGCLEAYASATALIRETKKAMANHKDSRLWTVGSADAVNGKTAFDFYNSDVYAKEVVDNYVKALACGITNFIAVFRPEAVVLGGGVCAQGDALINPVKEIVKKEIFAKDAGPAVEILTAKLGNDAGALGAAALVID